MGHLHVTTAGLALAALLLAAGAAQARDRCDLATYGDNATVRDPYGRIIGSIIGAAENGTFRDDRGRIAASSATSSTGLTTYRDDAGRVIGTRSVTGSGEVVYRDGHGSIVDLPPDPIGRFCPPE